MTFGGKKLEKGFEKKLEKPGREKSQQLEKITLLLKKNWKKQRGKSFKSRFGLKKNWKNQEEKKKQRFQRLLTICGFRKASKRL